MAKINPNFPHDVYRFLIKPLRDADETGVLEGYVGGVQQAFEQIMEDQSNILDLFDIDNCPEWALDYLLWIVGWTKPLQYITDGLTATQKRKVIRLSAQLWKQKGTPTGIKNVVRLFTGRDVVYWSWFYMRIETDLSIIGQAGVGGIDPWLVGTDYGDRDQHLSFCWIMDEDGVDKELIHDVIQMNRPMGEAIKVCYANVVDDFQLGVGKWTAITGADPDWDDVNYRMTIKDGSAVQANVLGLDIEQHTFTASFRLTTSATVVRWQWSADNISGAPNYALALDIDNAGKSVHLEQCKGGVWGNVQVAALSALPVGSPVSIVMHVTRETSAQLRVRASIDGVPYIDALLNPGDEPDPGYMYWDATSAGADYQVDNVIIFAHPLYTDTIEAGDADIDAAPVLSVPSMTDITPNTWATWSNWPKTGKWHATTFRHVSPKGPGALYFGQAETGYYTWGSPGNYNGGPIINDFATAPIVNCAIFSALKHRIWLQWWQDTRISYLGGEDDAVLEILNGGAPVHTYTKSETVGVAPSGGWVRKRINITQYAAGQAAVAPRFRFNPLVIHGASDEGWYIDDVRILVEKV